jgi:transcriptional regulator with XRE-family HTH domain
METIGERLGETLAQRLRRLRKEQGYTIVGLSKVVGVSEGALRQLERGQVKVPSFLLGVRLSNALNVDPMYLALGEGMSTRDLLALLDRRLAKVERWIGEQPKRR